MKTQEKLLAIADKYLLKILLVAFIFFIPLYPKFPFRFINYTYVAVRLEDLFVAVIVLLFFSQLIRRKIVFHELFLRHFLIFWLIASLSLVSGILITKTIEFPHLALLHVLRRVEYMTIFFIVASLVKTFKDFRLFFSSFIISLLLVNLYGIGQRSLGFPGVSTMNPEYARGLFLSLTQEARISSTFGGHYDLAIYLVFSIPLVLGLYFSIKRIVTKLLLLALTFFCILILALTASRISFVAFIISTYLFLFFLKKYQYLIVITLVPLLLVFVSGDLVKRFAKTVEIKQILVNRATGEIHIPQKITTKVLPGGGAIELPKEPQEEIIITTKSALFKEDLIKEAVKKARIKAAEDGIPFTASDAARIVASLSANIKPAKGLVYDISFSTRVQVEWQRAIRAFLKNPLLGTGPSSITEATDNDYLRLLGEFGALGFIAFTSILVTLLRFISKHIRELAEETRPVFYAFFFSFLGLLINATYIDVFEASKVAFIFWWTMGIYIGVLSYDKKKIKDFKFV